MDEFEDNSMDLDENKGNDDEEFGENSEDSDNSDLEQEEHNALERKVVDLRKQLSKNPNDYNLHLELITSLKKLGELDQLRHARETMSTIYPLGEELWLDWLRDEIKLATTKEEKEKIEKLFERAVEDYLSIEIWLECIQFSLSSMENGTEGIAKIRQVMEKAVLHGGLHVSKGALLWDSYREFEITMFQTIQGQETEIIESQARRVTQLFQRQLSVPLLDMDNTWSEYEAWLKTMNQEIDENVKSLFEKAKNILLQYSPLEDELLVAENESKLKVYQKYISLEKKTTEEPVRIQALYERSVAELPLYDTLWNDYCKYVDRQLKEANVTLSVYNRAVRNCPWNSSLWTNYIFAAQRHNKENSFISGLVESAFQGGLSSAQDCRNVWMSFLEYLVRKCEWGNEDQVQQLREAFNQACEHLAQNYGLEGDTDCSLLQYWAFIEAKKMNNMTKARQLWGDILSQGHSKSAQWWLSYIQFERSYGEEPNLVRRLFTKSLNAIPSTDWPELIVQQWLQFEREEGDLETMENAILKCESKMEKVTQEREQQQTQEVEKQTPQKAPSKGTKRATESEPEFKVPAPKKVKVADTSVNPAPVKEPSPSTAVQKPTDSTRYPQTVFISNLDYNVVEDDIRKVMSESGTITELRLVRDYKQRSKGFCYVEFSSQKEAQCALKRDRELLNGRPMFISPCEANAALKHPVFKFQTNLEKNKLFVKGLPPTVTKEELEKLFAAYGVLKDVRIVTYRSGHSKGLAYVEYLDEAAASLALVKTDGMQLQDKVITVALSNPPQRKTKDIEQPSLGSGSRSRRSQVALIPNTVLRNKQATASVKSNAEFRQMLFNNGK